MQKQAYEFSSPNKNKNKNCLVEKCHKYLTSIEYSDYTALIHLSIGE